MRCEERLRKAGYRLTAARRAVIQVLEQTVTPLSPHDVWRRGQRLQPALGLASVYRFLDLLEDLALVRRIYGLDGSQGYIAASPGHKHTILCRACRQAVEFSGTEDLQELVARVQQQTGYRVEGHLLQLSGLCPACQAAG